MVSGSDLDMTLHLHPITHSALQHTRFDIHTVSARLPLQHFVCAFSRHRLFRGHPPSAFAGGGPAAMSSSSCQQATLSPQVHLATGWLRAKAGRRVGKISQASRQVGRSHWHYCPPFTWLPFGLGWVFAYSRFGIQHTLSLSLFFFSHVCCLGVAGQCVYICLTLWSCYDNTHIGVSFPSRPPSGMGHWR